MMTKLEVILQPSRFEAVKEVLTELGIGKRDTRRFIRAANIQLISSQRSNLRLFSLTSLSIPPWGRF
jgi:hypothetical protein